MQKLRIPWKTGEGDRKTANANANSSLIEYSVCRSLAHCWKGAVSQAANWPDSNGSMAMPSSELGNFTSGGSELIFFQDVSDCEIRRFRNSEELWIQHFLGSRGVGEGVDVTYNKDCWPAWWPFLLWSFPFPSGQNLFLSSCSNSGGLVNLGYLNYFFILFLVCCLIWNWDSVLGRMGGWCQVAYYAPLL